MNSTVTLEKAPSAAASEISEVAPGGISWRRTYINY